MAVTLQLARASQCVFEQCASDLSCLRALVNYELLPKCQYEDLNWFPAIMKAVVPFLGLPKDDACAIVAAVSGKEVLASAEGLDIYSDVTICDASTAEAVAQLLDRTPFRELVVEKLSSGWGDVISNDLWNSTVSPVPFLNDMYQRMENFFKEAGSAHQAVAYWWN